MAAWVVAMLPPVIAAMKSPVARKPPVTEPMSPTLASNTSNSAPPPNHFGSIRAPKHPIRRQVIEYADQDGLGGRGINVELAVALLPA